MLKKHVHWPEREGPMLMKKDLVCGLTWCIIALVARGDAMNAFFPPASFEMLISRPVCLTPEVHSHSTITKGENHTATFVVEQANIKSLLKTHRNKLTHLQRDLMCA